jgi:ABC-type sugar transport system ATPase subunit
MSQANLPGTLALRLSGVTKRFPGVTALDQVDLDLHRGEIHALLGENGAGKSTLIKILNGIYVADDGDFIIGGSPVVVTRPNEASRLGITVVPQDILMVPEFSIGRNILLGGEGSLANRGRLSAAERQTVVAALAKVGATFDPDTKTSTLSVPRLRLAQIARALVHPGEIMILDEPTAVLSEPDAELLIERVMNFRSEGKAVLYVTHRLSEVMRLADRITILRDGKRVGVYGRGELSRADIVRLMAKDSPSAARATSAAAEASGNAPSTAAETKGTAHIQIRDLSSGRRFTQANLTASAGRIVGIAGVQGSGHGHLLRAVAGVDVPDSGEIRLDGRPLPLGSVRHAVKQGVLLVPADRRGAAIVPSLSVRANLCLGDRVRHKVRRFGLRWPKDERAMATYYIDRLSVRPPYTEARIGALSGGNQQKVAIARALEGNARVLLIEEPTQGVDVGAKAEIHALLRRVADESDCVVIIATSEFEELIGLADDVHVMREGRMVANFPGSEATYHRILENALS